MSRLCCCAADFWRVGWDQIVGAVEFDAVPGIEQKRRCRPARTLFSNALKRSMKSRQLQVLAERDLEAEPLQALRHRTRVVCRLLERIDVLVGVIADNEGETVGLMREA